MASATSTTSFSTFLSRVALAVIDIPFIVFIRKRASFSGERLVEISPACWARTSSPASVASNCRALAEQTCATTHFVIASHLRSSVDYEAALVVFARTADMLTPPRQRKPTTITKFMMAGTSSVLGAPAPTTAITSKIPAKENPTIFATTMASRVLEASAFRASQFNNARAINKLAGPRRVAISAAEASGPTVPNMEPSGANKNPSPISAR